MHILKFIPILFVPMALTSCIQDEAPNAEADINSCSIESEYVKSDPVITNDKVIVLALPQIDRTRVAPVFELTPGATIEPPSGTVRDFTTPQSYTVTSEDRNWSKTYTVSIDTSELTTSYHFDNYEVIVVNVRRYHSFYEQVLAEGTYFRQDMWATANSGYSLTGMPREPEDYPTYSIPDGVDGRGVKLETKSTGQFGYNLKMPIAPGNMFIGSFDASKAMEKPLEATHFGLPFGKEPDTLKGYYKYKAGVKFTDKDTNVIEGRTDLCDIYAVFYETDESTKYLNGADVLIHPNIIALARIPDARETDQWAEFVIPFDYMKAVDPEKLRNYKYNLAVVFTSSVDGAHFMGAVGSMLWVDEVEVICK